MHIKTKVPSGFIATASIKITWYSEKDEIIKLRK
jgi:hypothetical protein